jgi:hypothetical protein
MKTSDKAVLRIGLDRLSQALRKGQKTDKAIDLGIALEAMLLHGIGRDELSYRAAVRAATFLGGSADERLGTFKLVRDAYQLRSSAVHTGKVSEGGKPLAVEVLRDASITCAALARKLIERGSFPSWESEYVVGTDQQAEADN